MKNLLSLNVVSSARLGFPVVDFHLFSNKLLHLHNGADLFELGKLISHPLATFPSLVRRLEIDVDAGEWLDPIIPHLGLLVAVQTVQLRGIRPFHSGLPWVPFFPTLDARNITKLVLRDVQFVTYADTFETILAFPVLETLIYGCPRPSTNDGSSHSITRGPPSSLRSVSIRPDSNIFGPIFDWLSTGEVSYPVELSLGRICSGQDVVLVNKYLRTIGPCLDYLRLIFCAGLEENTSECLLF